METRDDRKILLCLIPALDKRWISREETPFLAQAFEQYPSAAVRTTIGPELLSTIVTGMNPAGHGVWQTKIKVSLGRTPMQRLMDVFPDDLAITAQCVIHRLTGRCDVPTLPPRRRRQFELKRLRLRGRAGTRAIVAKLQGVKTVADAIGSQEFSFCFTDRFEDRDWLVSHYGSGDHRLEIVDFHALDLVAHWYLDTPAMLSQCLRQVDQFVKDFSEKCRASGVTMALLSDHGMEDVVGVINLQERIERLGLKEGELSSFTLPGLARFWFHTDRARRSVIDLLSETPNGRMYSYEDLKQFQIEFEDASYGDYYFLADPGYLIFPHDFYHLVTTYYLGLFKSKQRRRLRTPLQLRYHGYDPEHDSQKGFLVMFDPRLRLDKERIDLADVAPTLLDVLGCEVPDWMQGRSRYWPRN